MDVSFVYLGDVDGYLVTVDGQHRGVVDSEDLDDYCPLWKLRDDADPAALLAQVDPYIHPRKDEAR
ncbi:hypothetical protein CF165_08980 [Amycolatopsis vastitatis]|uniref:Uncharacterized protein n=1 Tax=Amycolatopsis vastitatis TaxID=1905142 RepID=A0A229TEF0_9PSEU|nr:hypothetical protein CF165_08980 [Amycolatopsis vastitatis]